MVPSSKAGSQESESGREAAPTLDGGALSGGHGDEAHVRVRTTRIGRFTLLHEIGSGGMGAVFAAYDEQLDRKVALKILRQTRSGAQLQRQRTIREARAAARITHPNVIAVYEVGENDGNIHIAMEYIEGGTLLEWQTQARRPWREILKMYLQAGEALLAAHDAEVVHRDFKPDNVLIGADGRPRVVDFGLARVGWMDLMSDPAAAGEVEDPAAASSPDQAADRASQSSRLTLPGVISGTPGYMSPEQYRGGDVDSRSDQWSFCAALFEALYGFLPFAGESVHEHAESVHGPPRSPPLDTKVPEEVHRALRRGLRTDPDQRFPSMAELLSALAQEQRDDEAAGALSRQRFSIAYAAACVLAIGIVQARMTRNGVTHRDAILVSCLVLIAILGGGLSRRSTLLSHRFHRHMWTLLLVTSAENLLQRIVAWVIDLPMPRVLPFEMVVLAANTAIAAALFMPWIAFVPVIPLAAAFLAVKGYATGRLLSFVYVLVAVLIGIGWNKAAKRVERREEGTGSGRPRRTPSSPSYRHTPDRGSGQSRPGGTYRTTPPRSTPPQSAPPRSTPRAG